MTVKLVNVFFFFAASDEHISRLRIKSCKERKLYSRDMRVNGKMCHDLQLHVWYVR